MTRPPQAGDQTPTGERRDAVSRGSWHAPEGLGGGARMLAHAARSKESHTCQDCRVVTFPGRPRPQASPPPRSLFSRPPPCPAERDALPGGGAQAYSWVCSGGREVSSCWCHQGASPSTHRDSAARPNVPPGAAAGPTLQPALCGPPTCRLSVLGFTEPTWQSSGCDVRTLRPRAGSLSPFLPPPSLHPSILLLSLPQPFFPSLHFFLDLTSLRQDLGSLASANT